jgi:hypothetical protein
MIHFPDYEGTFSFLQLSLALTMSVYRTHRMARRRRIKARSHRPHHRPLERRQHDLLTYPAPCPNRLCHDRPQIPRSNPRQGVCPPRRERVPERTRVRRLLAGTRVRKLQDLVFDDYMSLPRILAANGRDPQLEQDRNRRGGLGFNAAETYGVQLTYTFNEDNLA